MNFHHTSAGLEQLKGSLVGLDLVFIVPPFVKANRPSYAVHLLKAIATQAGIKTGILYSNLALHCFIEKSDYDKLTIGSGLHPLVGDLVFRDLAYGQTSFKQQIESRQSAKHKRLSYSEPHVQQQAIIEKVQPQLNTWLETILDVLLTSPPKIIGLTSTFDQNNASIALINAIKNANPKITTLIGGANCEDEMAIGIQSLNSKVDYIFSGESDTSLIPNLNRLLKGEKLQGQIINSKPVMDLDQFPNPDYDEFYNQSALFMTNHDPIDVSLPYETSRGCWWGQKHHCTFCGLNGDGMVFRFKSADKITAELKKLKSKYKIKKIQMVDNIMPMNYFKDLLPELSQANLELEIFYEQKANLDVSRLVALKEAGISVIQPGIESFSSDLLKLMDKGVSGSQNLLLLRNAMSLGISLAWNLLYAFPSDKLTDYQPTKALLPSITHLQPPIGFFHLSLDRFSMYHKNPEKYGINDIKPLDAYADIYPHWAKIEKLAYYFEGHYESEIKSNPELITRIDQLIRDWQQTWRLKNRPYLHLRKLSENSAILLDSRFNSEQPQTKLLTMEQAKNLAMPCSTPDEDKDLDEAITNRWGCIWDNRYIPLMTLDDELLKAWH